VNAEHYRQRLREAKKAKDDAAYERIIDEMRDLAPRLVECPGCHQRRDVHYSLSREHEHVEHRIQEHDMSPQPQISDDQRRYAYVYQRCWGSGALVGYWKDIKR